MTPERSREGALDGPGQIRHHNGTRPRRCGGAYSRLLAPASRCKPCAQAQASERRVRGEGLSRLAYLRRPCSWVVSGPRGVRVA